MQQRFFLFKSIQVRKPGKTEFLDESIYYKRDAQVEKPVEVLINLFNIDNKFILKGYQAANYQRNGFFA